MFAIKQVSPESLSSNRLARMASCKYIVEESDSTLKVVALSRFPWILVGITGVVLGASGALAAIQASYRLPPDQNLSIGGVLSDERSLLILGIVSLVLVGIWIVSLSSTARMLQLNPLLDINSFDRRLTLDGVERGSTDRLAATVDVGFRVNEGVDSREYEYQRSLMICQPGAQWIACQNMLPSSDLHRIAQWINRRTQACQKADE